MSDRWFGNQNMHSQASTSAGQHYNQQMGSSYYPMQPNFSQPPPFSYNRAPRPPLPPLPIEPPPQQPPPPPPPGVDWMPPQHMSPMPFRPNRNGSIHQGPRHRNPHGHNNNNHRFGNNQQISPKKRRAEPNTEDGTLPRKKPMSKSYPTKPWNAADAAKAEQAEMTMLKKNEQLILKVQFPEPDITSDMVSQLHPAIENVHFQVPGSARYCFVQINKDANAETVIEQLKQTDFYGKGFLTCERKAAKTLSADQKNNDRIDPYTLYLGNLPLNLASSTLKNTFKSAQRVDIGYAQRMKCTRYAFIRFPSVDDAIEAFKHALTLRFDSRSLIVRFRRQRSKDPPPKPVEEQERPVALCDTVFAEKIKEEQPDDDDPIDIPVHVQKGGSQWTTDSTGRTKKVLRDEDLTDDAVFPVRSIKQEPANLDGDSGHDEPKNESAENNTDSQLVLGGDNPFDQIVNHDRIKKEPIENDDDEDNFSDGSDFGYSASLMPVMPPRAVEPNYSLSDSEPEPEPDSDDGNDDTQKFLARIKKEPPDVKDELGEHATNGKTVIGDDDLDDF